MSEPDEEIEVYDGPEMALEYFLRRDEHSDLLTLWNKTLSRLSGDPTGAITSAKTLVEHTCKMITEATGGSVDGSHDLPKLYRFALEGLGLGGKGAQSQTDQSIARSLYTIVNVIAAKRNSFGDAHSRAIIPSAISQAQADLVVGLASAITLYLLRQLDGYRYSQDMLNEYGLPVLKFEKSIVWRLVDHARNSESHAQWFGEDVGASLVFVGDHGIYLMSNGVPGIPKSGVVRDTENFSSEGHLVAYADGCDPKEAVLEHWWRIHNLVDDGSDFSMPIEVEGFLDPLGKCNTHIVIFLRDEDLLVIADREFDELQ